MTFTPDPPQLSPAVADDITLALAVYNAYREARTTIRRMPDFLLTVDQAFTLTEIGVSAAVSPAAADNVVRSLLQRRAGTASDLIYRKLVVGGAEVGQRYELSERGVALCASATALIEDELAFSLRQADAARKLHCA